jgi:hypothetical protein
MTQYATPIPLTQKQLEAENGQLLEWAEFDNGTRVFLALNAKDGRLTIALRHKDARSNSLYDTFELKKRKRLSDKMEIITQ